jgi:hypothetical protein
MFETCVFAINVILNIVVMIMISVTMAMTTSKASHGCTHNSVKRFSLNSLKRLIAYQSLLRSGFH